MLVEQFQVVLESAKYNVQDLVYDKRSDGEIYKFEQQQQLQQCEFVEMVEPSLDIFIGYRVLL